MATLINIAEVMAKLPGDHHTDQQLFTKHIRYAEDRHVVPFLGQEWYDALVTAAAGSASTTLVTTNLAAWERWLHEICTYAVVYEAYPFSAYRITSMGIVRTGGNNAEPVSNNEVKFARSAVLDRLKQTQQLAHDWLTHEDRSADYPLYIGNKDKCEPGSLGAEDFGIVFGTRKRSKGWTYL